MRTFRVPGGIALRTSSLVARQTRRCAAGVDDGRLCPRRKVPAAHDAARLPRRRAADVARRRTLLVPRDHGKGHRGGPGRRRGRHRASLRRFRSVRVRPSGRGRGAGGDTATPPAKRHAVARRQAHRLHPGLEPLGARRRDRQGDAAHDRRRQGLRLRHRQRRLDAAATARSCCGRPTRRRSRPSSRTSASVGEMYLVDTAVGHPELQAWKYPLPGDEIVTMIQRVVIDVDAGEGRPAPDAARPASLHALRRRRVPRRRMGRRAVEPGRHRTSRSSRPRATTSSEAAARRRRGDRRGPRRARGEASRRSSSRATAASTGATCRRRTR